MIEELAGSVRSDFRLNRLYLVDAMALAYRSHFIFISRPLINSKGMNTSAAFGFTNALLKLIEDHGMENIAVVFDAVGPEGTFRDEIYEAYKANRSPIPEELVDSLPIIKRIIQAFNIPVLEIPGVEADDVIGTLAKRAEKEGAEVVIVSPDKDFQQLLSPLVSIFRPAHRGEEFDPITPDTFREKYGLEPEQFIDVLALMGDASDNVPGVPGIGEKTAAQLIQSYGSVENLLEHVDEVKGKRAKEGLMEHADDALLSKRLVTIRTDVDVDLDWHKCRMGEPNVEELVALFTELEFNTLLRRVQENDLFRTSGRSSVAVSPGDILEESDLTFDFGPYEALKRYDPEKAKYKIVRNEQELYQLAENLKTVDTISLDTETTSTDQMMASLVGISMSWEAGTGWYVPTPLPDGMSTEQILGVLGPLLQEKNLIGHNLKYDIVVLARHGLRLHKPVFDTMVAHYLVSPEEPHGLDAVARKYLNYVNIPISSLIGTGKQQLSMRDVPLDDIGIYACEDADISLQLHDIFQKELESAGLLKIAEEMEFPLIYVLADMEMTGIRVDPAVLSEISEILNEQLSRIEAEIYRVAGREFNIGSTQQLSDILFNRLGLRVVGKTSTGKASTKETVLSELCADHPLPCLILDWREVTKLKSTYVDALGGLIHPETGRIHTNFNQVMAATGRLSSYGPNLQNIPVRTALGREIRKAFVPERGWKLMAADYVQIELRILASMSGDEAMQEAFRKGEDIHAATAARVFGVPLDKVTRDQRRKAKEVNYGIPYGVSAWGLAQRLRAPVKEAQDLIDQYMRSYPRITQFLAKLVEDARQKGYAETMLGRRRYIPGINARNRNERSAAERIAVNMPIQGTQADMIKIAMVRLKQRMDKEKLRSRMLLQVHDELIFEAPEEELDVLAAMLREEMTGALELRVPVEVDINVADNWLDAH